jgi:gamma-glutamylaminecyclotransferase
MKLPSTKMIFVYGTLKQGHLRSHLLANQQYLGEFQTEKGYSLYNCGSFPGIISTKSNDFAYGEIWEIQEDCLPYLDKIEGSPFLFKLQLIKIDNVPFEVYAYFWQKSTDGLTKCGPYWSKTMEKEP